MQLVQISRRRGFVQRVPIGAVPPPVELYLAEHQRIIDFDIHAMIGGPERVTEDYAWTATIETRL